MRKKIFSSTLISLLFLLLLNISSAQVPQLTVDGKSNNGVVLQNLQIDIKICGNVAKTSWQMVFKNNTGRILEGTLNFPLKDGISVSRYALDINGKMREAVAVDRGKGATVFEAIERRRVDPGLLEKVEGNTFRTRIYPINAHSSRTVLIGYEEELPIMENELLHYYMPLNLKDTIADFSFNIEVIQSATRPVFDAALPGNLHFDKRNNVYTASLHKTNYVPEYSLSFTIPKPLDATEVMLQEFENKYYYLINTRLEKNEQPKQLPQNITLLWDASLSGGNRNIKMETALLDAYFKKVNTANLMLVIFSNKIYSTKKYTLQKGNWNELKNAIDSIQYDGATNLGGLQLGKLPGDEFLLMSDGHQTFGNTNMQLSNKPVYCLNSAASADYSHLKYIALKTGGAVIDLQSGGLAASLNQLTMVPLRFMGIQQNSDVEENYPSMRVPVGNSFSAAGIATPELKEIILQFGYGNKITITKKIAIEPDKQLCENFDISKLFAQKKIAELDIQYDENKQSIESLGKRFGIVTRNTSLIVLETINDYLQYNIEPPAELRNEYDRVIKQRSREITLKTEDNMKAATEMMEELKEWWRAVKKPVVPVVKKTVVTSPQPLPPSANTNPRAARLQPNPTGVSKTIRGKVADAKDNNPLIGATINIKGKRSAMQSDRNGNYMLQVRDGEILQYSAAGYISREIRVNNAATVNVTMQKSGDLLEEVVVVGYGVQRKVNLTGSVTSISIDNNLSSARSAAVSQELAGKLSGVQITNANSDIAIRGATSSITTPGPLYIIDGRVTNQNNVDENDIERTEVLQGGNATAIYGLRAANGAVVITTKNKSEHSADSVGQTNLINNTQINTSTRPSFNIETTDYIKILKSTDKAGRYEKYLELRKYYMNNPVYFFEVAGYFLKTGDKETGLKILSNLAELETGSYELYKMLGYKLKETGDYEAEMIAFKKVIELRPLDPQSYRDYALALEDAGYHQEALNQLYEGMTRSYSQEMRNIYAGIEEIFLMEINRLITLHSNKLKLKDIPKTMIQAMPVDLRVVMNWNMNNTDIDLSVTDPNEEKCMFNHRTTAVGGRISDDFTQGFGPEQFILKNAQKGKYRIEINYFGNSQVTLAGPATVMAEIYLHYGMPNEEKRTVTLQMEKGKSGAVFIGEVAL
ncbi:MAG: carboxypeptidase-like regulatory domain-containing protein [Ferruginibacter sp.]|nr:carboxypeptidase-like regulatory domain-containing protein [Ferruginibacter sp.]